MSDVFIVSAARTPIGKFGGLLRELSPAQLGAHAMRAVLARADVSGADLDLYIVGHVLRAAHGQLVPRQAAFGAGIPAEVDGYAVDMVCSSGMMALTNAATMIRAGEADLVLAGGMESMSQAAFALPHAARWGYRMLPTGMGEFYDTLIVDGLTDPIERQSMGAESERLIEEYKITRQELDEVAFESHRRASEATARGLFRREIAPIEIAGRSEPFLLDRDEGIRSDTTREGLAKLRPVFRREGLLTAGNASQISDGAAALLLASERAVAARGLQPIGRLLGSAWAAVESWRFVEAPVPAVRKLLARLRLDVDAFDLVENNEAFAANSVLFHKVLGIPYAKLNPWGGAIALGHPIGCSGARIVVTLLSALAGSGGHLGLASLCHGTGGGTALAVERL